MKKFIATSLASAAFALMAAVPPAAPADEVTIEQRTTYPGRVVIENESSRTFKLQGDTRTYTAPSDVDLRSLDGRDVTVHVGPSGSVTRVERKTMEVDDDD